MSNRGGSRSGASRWIFFGIAAKVLLALLLSLGVAVGGLVLLGKALEPVGSDLRSISKSRIPALLRTSQLLRQAYRLTALSPDILIAETPLTRAELSELAAAIPLETRRVVTALGELGVEPQQTETLEQDFAAVERKLRVLTDLSGQLHALDGRLAEATGRLRRLSANIGRLGGAAPPACLTRWTASARQAVVELMAVHSVSSRGWLEYLERAYQRALDAMADERACALVSDRRKVGSLDREIRLLGGADGPFQLRRRQIELRSTLEAQLGRGRYLGDHLVDTVAALFAEVGQEAEAESRRVEQLVAEHRLLLVMVTLTLSLITLATYLYLDRALISPILRLRRAIDAHEPGEQPERAVPFPKPRADEIGSIVGSVRGFVEDRDRRERELRQAKAEADQARRTAESASRAKTRFLAQVSHELRTPLNAVLGYSDLLRESAGLDEHDRERCTRIRRGAKHLLRLIEDLLDAAALDSGRLEPDIAALDLVGLLRNLDDFARDRTEQKGLTYQPEHAPGLPERVRTDGRRVEQILTNLLDNAVKYTDRGRVTFRSRLLDGGQAPLRMRFEVEDTGPGIPPGERERLFAPFERVHSRQPGTGLGLAICRELAGLMGGTLDLESTPGQGSLFRFELPVELMDTEPEEDDAESVITGYLGPTRRLLVVDDDPVSRLFLCDLLTRLGFDARAADGAATAISAVQNEAPDLVLMDLVMPGCCGYAATWALREQTRADLPVIAASATPLPSPEDATELGFDGFLTKPIERPLLTAAIGACLRMRWTYRESSPNVAQPGSSQPTGDQGPEPPPPIEFHTLLELVELGERAQVLAWCDDLAAGEPHYAPFTERVRSLAAEPRMQRLRDWLAALF